jgi:hypothetical protein
MRAHSSAWLERFPDKEEVDGSSPSGPTQSPPARLSQKLGKPDRVTPTRAFFVRLIRVLFIAVEQGEMVTFGVASSSVYL